MIYDHYFQGLKPETRCLFSVSGCNDRNRILENTTTTRGNVLLIDIGWLHLARSLARSLRDSREGTFGIRKAPISMATVTQLFRLL